jgi:hypothetical protein
MNRTGIGSTLTPIAGLDGFVITEGYENGSTPNQSGAGLYINGAAQPWPTSHKN